MGELRFALGILPITLLAACANVQVDGNSPAAVTGAAFAATLGFARVEVPANSRLSAAVIDGKPAFCTPFPAYYVPGERRAVCFFDNDRTGYLTSYYVLGTLRSETFDAHIPYALVGSAPSMAGAVPATQTPESLTEAEHAQLDEIRASNSPG
jgi:hypothetical protein